MEGFLLGVGFSQVPVSQPPSPSLCPGNIIKYCCVLSWCKPLSPTMISMEKIKVVSVVLLLLPPDEQKLLKYSAFRVGMFLEKIVLMMRSRRIVWLLQLSKSHHFSNFQTAHCCFQYASVMSAAYMSCSFLLLSLRHLPWLPPTSCTKTKKPIHHLPMPLNTSSSLHMLPEVGNTERMAWPYGTIKHTSRGSGTTLISLSSGFDLNKTMDTARALPCWTEGQPEHYKQKLFRSEDCDSLGLPFLKLSFVACSMYTPNSVKFGGHPSPGGIRTSLPTFLIWESFIKAGIWFQKDMFHQCVCRNN